MSISLSHPARAFRLYTVMKLTELLLFGVLGYTAIGAAGIALSLLRGRRTEARGHALWLAAIVAAYFAALLVVSAVQPQRQVPPGHDQCFGDMCFAVLDATESPGLVAGDPSRVFRVSIRASNRGHSAHAESLISAFLVDARGRIFQPLPGLSGNLLTARVGAGSQMISQPLFRVPPDAAGLGLVLTHGHWQLGRLVLGDPDSIGHKPAIALLRR